MNNSYIFEEKCEEYLNNKYSSQNLKYKHHGGFNSTCPDIEVIAHGKSKFFIEVKMKSAQSGQFVLIPDHENKVFSFSSKNRSEPNENTDIIIEAMNKEFKKFVEAGTKGEDITIDSNVYINWIKDYYKKKNVKYIISYLDDFTIIPIEKFNVYFKTTAKYRKKRSGTQNLPKRLKRVVTNSIKNLYPNASVLEEGKKLFLIVEDEIIDNYLHIDNETIYISKKNSNKYELRKRSKTTNLNVIFSIDLINNQIEEDLIKFKNEIESYEY